MSIEKLSKNDTSSAHTVLLYRTRNIFVKFETLVRGTEFWIYIICIHYVLNKTV